MISFSIIVLVFLIIVTVIDISTRTVPSIFTTTILFITVYYVALTQPTALAFGILGGLLGLALYEINFYKGVADIKVTAIIGLMTGNQYNFISFMIMFVLIFVPYMVVWKAFINDTDKETAFLPVLLLTYMGLMSVGGLI